MSMHTMIYSDGQRQADGSIYVYTTAGDWYTADADCTGEVVDVNDDIVPPETPVTLRCVAGHVVEYRIGHGGLTEATWMSSGYDD